MPDIRIENHNLDVDCMGQRYWYAFLLSSLITFFGGLTIIIIWRFLTYICFGHGKRKLVEKVFYNLQLCDPSY